MKKAPTTATDSRSGEPEATASAFLGLADGSRWIIRAEGERATPIIEQMREVMGLPAAPHRSPGPRADDHHIHVVVEPFEREAHRAALRLRPLDGNGAIIRCPLIETITTDGGLAPHYLWFSAVLARHLQPMGGVLLHGALAEYDIPSPAGHRRKGAELEGGLGAILAGPGTIGKSTASERLPPPWRALCDDTTLVVRDADGQYWAHPWPTWSRFMFGRPGGNWNVQHAVPLQAIFFLDQSPEDHVEPMGAGTALTKLVASAEQVSNLMTCYLKPEQARAIRMERFENLNTLARAVPAYTLRLSLTGAFWEKMASCMGTEESTC
jgi:SynChlorMet cassette protein ScmC